MRFFLRMLLIVFFLQSVGAPAWATYTFDHGGSQTDNTHQSMIIYLSESNSCCDTGSMELCALKCFSGCSAVFAVLTADTNTIQPQMAKPNSSFREARYSSFNPSPEIPPPSV